MQTTFQYSALASTTLRRKLANVGVRRLRVATKKVVVECGYTTFQPHHFELWVHLIDNSLCVSDCAFGTDTITV